MIAALAIFIVASFFIFMAWGMVHQMGWKAAALIWATAIVTTGAIVYLNAWVKP